MGKVGTRGKGGGVLWGKVGRRRVRGDLRRHVGLSRADRSDSLCHLTLITDIPPSILTLHLPGALDP